MREWVKSYGVVCVLAVGLVGGLFLWAVNTQVDAQTSGLRADNAVFKVRLETIQKAQEDTDTRLKRLEDGQRNLRAEVQALKVDVRALKVEVKQGQAAILSAIRKMKPGE